MFTDARNVQDRSNDVEFEGIPRGAGFTTTEMIGDCFADDVSTARGFFAGNGTFRHPRVSRH